MGAATVVSTVIFMGAASPRHQFRIKVYNSGVDRERSRYPKLPFSFTSFAAPSSPVIAARYNDVARLIRRTPAASSSATDRKSTRLNSSHVEISYAVFCLK